MAIVSVVKYDGNPDVFAWKYPDSELEKLRDPSIKLLLSLIHI